MKTFVFLLLIGSLVFGDKSKPNILLIIADDLGNADVSFNSGKNALIKTPGIDRIAQEGVRLERFYACPVCSPTRVGTMIGRWPITLGLMGAVIPPWRKRGIEPEVITLPEILSENGYQRRAIIGKWHLGHASRKFLPLNQGFNHFYGHLNGAIDYFSHLREGENDWFRNEAPIFEKGYATDLLAAEADRFIRESHSQNEPFFIYLPFNAPHSPFQAKEEDIKKVKNLSGKQQVYAAMVQSMDRGIGQILETLDELKIADNTFVLFFSDNGGVKKVTSPSVLRDGKFSVYEGGIRVCAAARWPDGGILGGKSISSTPIGYIDVLPTLCSVAGINLEPYEKDLDGQNVLEIMRGSNKEPKRPWFSLIDQDGRTSQMAVIQEPYKLVVKIDKTNNERINELYDLRQPSEQNNLAYTMPEKVKELTTLLKRFQALQVNPMPPYRKGKKGFKPPKNWVIKE